MTLVKAVTEERSYKIKTVHFVDRRGFPFSKLIRCDLLCEIIIAEGVARALNDEFFMNFYVLHSLKS